MEVSDQLHAPVVLTPWNDFPISMGQEADVDMATKRKILPLPGIESRLPSR